MNANMMNSIYNPILSQIAGFITLFMMVISYLFKAKSSFLLCQVLGLLAMFVSYLFKCEFFAMVSLTVSLSRTLTFFIYEKKNKRAPLSLAYLFAALTLFAYITVNLMILKMAKPVDILFLIAHAGYAFVFRIRNIRIVRKAIIIPHLFAILYNLVLNGMLFVAISYSFELIVDLYSIYINREQNRMLESDK